jgi:hypothetical protein
MATDESGFRLEFRKGIKAVYPKAHVWPNSDRFTNGIADISSVVLGHFYPLEAKFVMQVPARDSTPILDHELSVNQYKFLATDLEAGGSPGVIVGFPDSFLAIPFSKWPDHKMNITMVEAIHYRERGYEFKKIKGVYQCAGIFELLRRENG